MLVYDIITTPILRIITSALACWVMVKPVGLMQKNITPCQLFKTLSDREIMKMKWNEVWLNCKGNVMKVVLELASFKQNII